MTHSQSDRASRGVRARMRPQGLQLDACGGVFRRFVTMSCAEGDIKKKMLQAQRILWNLLKWTLCDRDNLHTMDKE